MTIQTLKDRLFSPADPPCPGGGPLSWLERGLRSVPLPLLALLSALLAAVGAYHLLVILGHGNPDALCEGLVAYTGADWATACGRWAIRYLNLLSGNIIMPGVWVALYALCCALSALLLARLWSIKSPLAVCLTACLLTVNPTVIEQSLLQYMFMTWGVSNLLGVLFVYLCCTEGRAYRRYLLAPLSMAFAFGLYQACVGLMCACFCMTLILGLLRGGSVKEMLSAVLRFALSAALGTLLYFLILRVEIVRWGVDESERVQLFSPAGILSSLSATLPGAYRTYFAYFFDHRLSRSRFYALLFCIGLLWVLAALARLLRARRFGACAFAVLLLALIPAFSNLADIIFPYNEPVLIMQYQSMLVVPFLLALPAEEKKERAPAVRAVRALAALLCFFVFWTYLVSANATYRSYDLSYRSTYFAVSAAMNRVYALPDYSPEEVVAFAGFPDDALLRQRFPSYRNAYAMYDNLVFWDGMMGLQVCRKSYLLNYFGLDGGHVYGHLYNEAVASEEFREMPVWPAEGSVRRINQLILVKFSEDPTIFT